MNARHEALIRELVQDLRPVVRLPRLHSIASTVAGAAAVSAGLYLSVAFALGVGIQAPVGLEIGASTGLLVLGAGALTFALASAVPGRESLRWIGLTAALSGAALAMLSIPLTVGADEEATGVAWLGSAAFCTAAASLLALPTSAILLRFVIRAHPFRPSRALALGAIGGLALAVLPVQLACNVDGSLHGLVGHSLAPLTGGLVVFLGLRPFYRRASRVAA